MSHEALLSNGTPGARRPTCQNSADQCRHGFARYRHDQVLGKVSGCRRLSPPLRLPSDARVRCCNSGNQARIRDLDGASRELHLSLERSEDTTRREKRGAGILEPLSGVVARSLPREPAQCGPREADGTWRDSNLVFNLNNALQYVAALGLPCAPALQLAYSISQGLDLTCNRSQCF